MEYREQDSVRIVPGVGEVAQAALERVGVTTLHNLLEWYPRHYLDGSDPVPIARAPLAMMVAVRATVLTCRVRPSKNRHITMVEATVQDESGQLLVRWFNQKFLAQKLEVGSRWILMGVIQRFQGERVMASPILEEEPKILPVYAQTKGVSSKQFRGYLQWAVGHVTLDAWDLPEAVRQAEGLPTRKEALVRLHVPQHMAETETARRYLRFAEVFWFFCRTALGRRAASEGAGLAVPADVEYLRELTAGLPFELTPGQKKALWEIAQDMATGRPMTRLLNGDVGSGKTAVAALAAALVARAGYQTVILVPTEILAKQHQQSLGRLLERAGVPVALWTAAEKEGLDAAQIVVGTHAVLQESFSLPRLGLVVIDEQHRFGVRQRRLLRQQQEVMPHVLSMTATPIPRSLALALYGDLEMSVLRDKPKSRLPIITEVVYPRQRGAMHERILAELGKGNQIFVVCPLIEEKERAGDSDEGSPLVEVLDPEKLVAQEKKTVMAEAERLRREHPEYGVVEVIHGKLKAEEKRRIMDRMGAGEIQVLVATSVIEVGIDVPRATVIVIEGAERFGLAQLHQFRGRVGRGNQQSYCFLIPSFHGGQIDQRMQAMVMHDSGFELAEEDLRLRGPGDATGFAQSGLPDFRMASLTDVEFLQHVREIAQTYVEGHPGFLAEFAKQTYSMPTGGLE